MGKNLVGKPEFCVKCTIIILLLKQTYVHLVFKFFEIRYLRTCQTEIIYALTASLKTRSLKKLYEIKKQDFREKSTISKLPVSSYKFSNKVNTLTVMTNKINNENIRFSYKVFSIKI